MVFFRFESIDVFNVVVVMDGVVLKCMDFEFGKGWEFFGYEVGEDVIVKFCL